MKKNEEVLKRIEELLEEEYWVIDILPHQVPAESEGKYFAVEEYYLKSPQNQSIRQHFANLLLKLNCYYGFLVYLNDGTIIDAPTPELLEKLILQNEDTVDIILKSEDTLIMFRNDDLYMTVYRAKERVLDTVRSLAKAEGMFLWKPEQN